MGDSARAVVLAHASGFSAASAYLPSQVGGEKLAEQELLVSVVLSLASYVPEASRAELLKDRQVCVQLESLECLFQEEAVGVAAG
eukprot:2569300-Amphidinium_carterae.3